MLQCNFEQCPPYRWACWELVLDNVIEKTVLHVLICWGTSDKVAGLHIFKQLWFSSNAHQSFAFYLRFPWRRTIEWVRYRLIFRHPALRRGSQFTREKTIRSACNCFIMLVVLEVWKDSEKTLLKSPAVRLKCLWYGTPSLSYVNLFNYMRRNLHYMRCILHYT